jgi:hypothetical protein
MRILSFQLSILLLTFISLVSCLPLDRTHSDKTLTPKDNWIKKDRLGYFYKLDDSRQLVKFDQTGQILQDYMHPVYGVISSWDVSDPYKILVFYRAHQQLILLDNTLNILSEIDLSNFGEGYVELITMSDDGNYWLYDSYAQTLIKVNDALEIIEQSFPVYQETGSGFVPGFLTVNSNMILLGDTGKGIMEFDHLGNYNRMISVQNFTFIACGRSGIYYANDIGFYQYHPIIFEGKQLMGLERDTDYIYCFDPYKNELWLFEPDLLNFTVKTLEAK